MLKDLTISALDTELEALIQEWPDAPHNLLFKAARYSLLAGGKRLRPILTIATAQTFGAPLNKALIPACALELVHTYSLIHDDLPCMDDDDLRRGKPTLHKVYNEGQAVLTGDYLLTYAFEILSKAPRLNSDEKIALIQSLSKHAGSEGMLGGQVVDLQHLSPDKKLLEFMHLHKTASLIICSVEFGAIVAGCSDQDKNHLLDFGKNIGLAFQFVDDLLDNDGAAHLFGPEEARKIADKFYDSALDSLSKLSVPAPLLKSLADKLAFRNN